jgi:hypothetical protein
MTAAEADSLAVPVRERGRFEAAAIRPPIKRFIELFLMVEIQGLEIRRPLIVDVAAIAAFSIHRLCARLSKPIVCNNYKVQTACLESRGIRSIAANSQ